MKLDLKSLLEQAYENGRYGRTLNYGQPADSPLDDEDALWAESLVKDRKSSGIP